MEYLSFFLVGIGGFLGAIVRYTIQLLIKHNPSSEFPISTFIINIIGSFLIGLVISLLTDKSDFTENLKLLIVVGFLGGFTTFSSFSLDFFHLLKAGKEIIAISYSMLSVIFGIIAVFCGIVLVDFFRS